MPVSPEEHELMRQAVIQRHTILAVLAGLVVIMSAVWSNRMPRWLGLAGMWALRPITRAPRTVAYAIRIVLLLVLVLAAIQLGHQLAVLFATLRSR